MTRESAYCFGADLGGTKLAAALADTRGHIVAELTEPTDRRGVGLHQLGEPAPVVLVLTH